MATTTTESETASSTDLQLPPTITSDTRGKHRILAELKRLEQETRFLEIIKRDKCAIMEAMLDKIKWRINILLLKPRWFVFKIRSTYVLTDQLYRETVSCDPLVHTQEELEELETADRVSVVCPDLLLNIEKRPDALLPVTNGPLNPSWDRWFEGAQESRGCRCWIL